MKPESIEVELRGRLTETQAQRLAQRLDKEANFIGTVDRVFIDYSTYIPEDAIEHRQRDVRVRYTNGVSEIMIKTGGWNVEEYRREYSVKSQGSFDELVQAMALLGYKRGVLGRRLGRLYSIDGCDLIINEVPGHSWYFEIDVMTDAEHQQSERQRLKELCDSLGLTTFTSQEFFSYIKLLNSEANDVYDAESMPEDYFANEYGLS